MNSFWLENINKIEGSGILENDTNADVCIIGAGNMWTNNRILPM